MYGGTKKELERLLQDAGKITDKAYDMSKFSDVIEAIHVIQEQLGVSGTTGEEAAKTITGSMMAIKASMENLITGLADENADLDTLIQTVVDNALVFWDNIEPRFEQALNGISKAIQKIAPIIQEQLPKIIEDTLPSALDAVIGLVDGLVAGIQTALPIVMETINNALPQILEGLTSFISEIGQGIIDNLPIFLNGVEQILTSLLTYIKDNSQQFVEGANKVINLLVDALVDMAPLLFDAGIELLLSLIEGFNDELPTLLSKAAEIIAELAAKLVEPKTMERLLNAAVDLMAQLANGLVDAVEEIAKKAPEILDGLCAALLMIPEKLIEAGGKIAANLISGIFDWSRWEDVGYQISKGISDGIEGNNEIGETAKTVVANSLEEAEQLYKKYDDLLMAKQYVSTSLVDQIRQMEEEGITSENTALYMELTQRQDDLTDEIAEMGKAREAAKEEIKKWQQIQADETRRQHTPQFAFEPGTTSSEAVQAILDRRKQDEEAANQYYDDIAENAEEEQDELFDRLKKEQERNAKLQQQSLETQIANWQAIQAQFTQGSEEWYEAEERIFDLRQDLQEENLKSEKDNYNKQKEALEKQIDLTEMSYTEQVEAWTKLRDQYAENSEYYEEINEKILDTTRKSQDEYADIVQKSVDKIGDIYNDYLDEKQGKFNDVYGQYGLFDKVAEKEKVSGDELLENLRGQIKSVGNYWANLDKLRARGVDEGLVQALESMGVGAADELDALLALSDEKLDEYNNLYIDKNEQAKEIAEKTTKDKLAETNAAINDELAILKSDFDENGELMGSSFMDSLAKGMQDNTAAYDYVRGMLGDEFFSDSTTNGANGTDSYVTVTKEVSKLGEDTKGLNVEAININGIMYQNFDQLVKGIARELQSLTSRSAAGYAG